MSGSRLALVADDQRLASAIQTHLKKAWASSPLSARWTPSTSHLSRDTDAVLLLAAASRAEAEQVAALVQEIFIRKLPPIIMIVEDDPPRRQAAVDAWTPMSSHGCAGRTTPTPCAADPRAQRAASAASSGRRTETVEDVDPPPAAEPDAVADCRWSSASPWPPPTT